MDTGGRSKTYPEDLILPFLEAMTIPVPIRIIMHATSLSNCAVKNCLHFYAKTGRLRRNAEHVTKHTWYCKRKQKQHIIDGYEANIVIPCWCYVQDNDPIREGLAYTDDREITESLTGFVVIKHC